MLFCRVGPLHGGIEYSLVSFPPFHQSLLVFARPGHITHLALQLSNPERDWCSLAVKVSISQTDLGHSIKII